MRKILSSIIICFSFHSFSQTFPVSGEITTTNGVGINIVSEYLQAMSGRDQTKYVKIVTTMPFQNGKGMTSLYLDYWGYEKVWRTRIGWYVYNDQFLNPSISISGDYTHTGVVLANEGGYVTISIPIPAFSHYGHLTVNSLTEIKAVTSTWADGWSIEEESIPGTGNQKTVSIHNKLSTDGSIGIGINIPLAKLHVKGNSGSSETQINNVDGMFIENGGSLNSYYVLQTATTGGGKSFSITNAGNVGIGTDTPDEKLEVNGTVRSKKVKVEASDWPDYVFSPNFELRTLDEVEDFIEKNHHLPEVPSTQEIEVNGLDLGSMDATLLKKMEELTLYMIEMNKTIKDQGKRIEELEKENKELLEKVRDK
ncbi:hypothetical protein [Roseivirga sp.]|uniref:hypothetical protein n=1 Tax=Roseivirga sp. TaxID=1964215 RepID=UPI003B51DE18